jgi:polyphenol oxidase
MDTRPDPRPARCEVGRRRFLIQAGAAAGGLALAGRSVPAQDGHPAGAGSKSTPGPASHAGGGAAVAAAFQAENPNPPFNFQGVAMPQRKSFYDYSQADVAMLVGAYGNLKNLNANDPRSWLNQANIHAAHCGGNLLEVHQSWWFTVWHRCYLFFYERILASLSTSPTTFALPYWDWSNHPELPNTQFNESAGNPSPFFDTNSPLYDQNRFPRPGTTFSDDPLGTNVAFYTASDYLTQIQTDAFEDFCGSDPNDPNGRGAGDLEANPHNTVHTWTGIPQSPWNDMGNLTTAARDLLFFLHHANVDRQFTLWLGQNPAPALPAQGSPWYSQFFNFWDERGNAVSVTVQDALTYMAGNYQQPEQTFTLVGQPQEVPIGGTPKSVNAAEVPEAMKQRIARMPAALAAAPARHRPRMHLRIEGLEAPHDVPVIIHVFINKPDATLKDLNGANFVGTIHLLPSSAAHGKTHRPMNVTLNVTAKAGLLRQAAAGKGPTFTLVPVDPNLGAGAGAPTVKFRKIVLVAR